MFLGSKLSFVCLFILFSLGLGFEKNQREFSPEDPEELQERRKTDQKVDQRELDEFQLEENPNKGKARRNP